MVMNNENVILKYIIIYLSVIIYIYMHASPNYILIFINTWKLFFQTKRVIQHQIKFWEFLAMQSHIII